MKRRALLLSALLLMTSACGDTSMGRQPTPNTERGRTIYEVTVPSGSMNNLQQHQMADGWTCFTYREAFMCGYK